MKRICFLIASILVMATGFSQQPWPNKVSTPTQYRHLKIDSLIQIPTGATPSLNNSGNVQTRAGALFLVVTSTDTLLKLWTGERWIDVGGSQQTNILPNELIFGGSVTPLGGYNFHVQEATFRIDNVIYQSDAQDVTITASDPDFSRIDRIFLMANTSPPPSGIASVLEGELAVNPLEPQIDGDQIGLAFISIPAGASEPTIVSTFVYNENTGESTVTNTGTTTDPNNTTNVNTTYGGTKSLNVTNLTNNDQVFLTKPSGVWSVLGFDGASFFIKLKAVMPGSGNLRMQLFVGTTAVSTEVLIPLNKSNTTTYQPITIPAGSFGNITNTSITRVRLRYTKTGTNSTYSGFYLDDMFFVDGISQPSTAISITLIPPVGFQVSPTQTINNNGTWTMTQTGGTAGQYYGVTGWSNFPTTVQTLGALDGRTRAAEGATIDGTELFLQTVDATESGLATPDMFNRVYTRYYIQNGGDGDTLAYPINDSVTGIKSLKIINGGSITTTDTTIIFDMTGVGSGGARFGVIGEDDTGAEGRIFTFDEDLYTFSIESTDGSVGEYLRFDNQNIYIGSGAANINIGGGVAIVFDSPIGYYQMNALTDDGTATKAMVWNSGDATIHTVDLSGLGGGLTEEQVEDYVGAMFATDNGDIDFTYNDGTPDIAAAIKSGVIVNADINASAAIDATKLIDGSITNTELGYINTLTSNAQTQINAKEGTLTNSAGLAAALSDEEGSAGGFVRATSPTITTPAISGAISTSAAAQQGTDASGTGAIPYVHHIFVRADETLANSNTDQNLFTNTAHDVITVLANTTYMFEGTLDLTHGAVSHSLSLGFTPTTAVVTNISYTALQWVTAVGTQTASQTSVRVKATATTAVNAAGANATESVVYWGWITIGNTGGTITPQIKFSADPTGTVLLKAGSDMHIWAVGNDTFTELGPIN